MACMRRMKTVILCDSFKNANNPLRFFKLIRIVKGMPKAIVLSFAFYCHLR